jgi:hypothetical protein
MSSSYPPDPSIQSYVAEIPMNSVEDLMVFEERCSAHFSCLMTSGIFKSLCVILTG